jgi:two-component system LytT family response regulator
MRNGSEPSAATAGMAARVLIVEDEAHARHYLRELLEGEPHVEVVGESSNGVQGAQQIRELSPDIVFVDIQMPGLDGFGMIDQIAGSDRLSLSS